MCVFQRKSLIQLLCTKLYSAEHAEKNQMIANEISFTVDFQKNSIQIAIVIATIFNLYKKVD